MISCQRRHGRQNEEASVAKFVTIKIIMTITNLYTLMHTPHTKNQKEKKGNKKFDLY
jgi:hypothetical protein